MIYKPLLRRLQVSTYVLYILSSITSFCNSTEDKWALELRAAYFHPSSSLIRNIYGNGMANVQLECSRIIVDPWMVWMNLGYFSKNGSSLGLCSSTHMHVVPVSLGVNYFHDFDNDIRILLGLGGLFTHAHIDDDSDFVRRHLHDNGFGFVLKSAAQYLFHEFAYLSIFVDYLHQKIPFNGTVGFACPTFNISGVTVGAGIGLRF